MAEREAMVAVAEQACPPDPGTNPQGLGLRAWVQGLGV